MILLNILVLAPVQGLTRLLLNRDSSDHIPVPAVAGRGALLGNRAGWQ
jgi:hypothetical protein